MAETETNSDHEPAPSPHRFVIQAVLSARAALQKMLDTITPPELSIFEHVFAGMRTQLVHVAAKLRLADILEKEGPLTAADLAARTGAHADALERAMRALVSLGVFERRRDGKFQNNRTSRTLRTGALGGPAFAHFFGSAYHQHAWAEFEHSIMTGRSAFEKVHGKSFWDWCKEHPADGDMFGQAMAAATELDAPAVASQYPWSEVEEVCDVAGGSGTLITEVLAKNPRLRGVLFDEGHVLEAARARLERRRVADRCKLVAGDFFAAGSVPSGSDVYMLKDILHDWDDERCLAILGNVRRAMRERSRLLVIEMILVDDPKYPLVNLTDMQMLCVCSGGKQRSEAQLSALFEKARLRLQRVIPLPGFTSIVEATPT